MLQGVGFTLACDEASVFLRRRPPAEAVGLSICLTAAMGSSTMAPSALRGCTQITMGSLSGMTPLPPSSIRLAHCGSSYCPAVVARLVHSASAALIAAMSAMSGTLTSCRTIA